MAAPIPVVFSELLNLPACGVAAESIKFGTTSMESDKFITVCDNSTGTPQIVIVDMAHGNAVKKRPIKAEAAIMNPLSEVLALRSGTTLQIFNLELQARMKSCTMEETVVFWRWTAPNNIALVTATAVFHWSIEGDTPPQKLFDRHQSLAEGVQIINYQFSGDGKWCLLMGIKAGTAGLIDGQMQLYSVEKRVSQVLNGHTGVFTTITPEGRTDPAQLLCFEEKKPDQPPKLFVMEVGREVKEGTFRLQPQAIPVPADAAADFPVAMQASKTQGIVYMVTKMGYLYLFDVFSGKCLYRARITQGTIFVTAPISGGGILCITARQGQVLQVGINKQTLAPYIVSTLRDTELAMSLAGRLGLAGADDLYMAQFQQLLVAGNVAGAAKLAATSPNGILRNQDTIAKFHAVPAQPGAPQPLFQYFSILLEMGKLNAFESLELARPVLQQGKTQLLEKWLQEDKLECTEQLGDLVASVDVNMALSVYLRAQVPDKAIKCMMQRGEFDKIVAYATKVNYRADYTYMLQALIHANPAGALEFAKQLAAASLIDPNQVVELFMASSRIQETTAFLLEALKANKPEEGQLQTKLLEINLRGGSPQVADAILQNKMFGHYDRAYIGKLCEASGLTQRAMEHYTETDDIKRALLTICSNPQTMNPDFVLAYFGRLSPEVSIDCLKELLGRNMRGTITIVTQVAAKYSEQIGSEPLCSMFESFKCFEGMFMYLGQIVNLSRDPFVHFKYIEAAAKTQQYKEVERVCRDSTVFDPIAVKKLLMEAKLPDPRPLIHVCDRFDFVDEMTAYLYANNATKYIEVYCQKVSPAKTPIVVGKLLDLDCNEDFIRGLLNSVGINCPVDLLVEEVERRNRLRLLQPWLEALVATGNREAATHNAIGKIYIILNRDPTAFLKNNQFYDPAVLGKFCEKLDPSLAFTAYQRAAGACDEQLIAVCNANGLFKDLARYLVEKQDPELWATVLSLGDEGVEKPNRRALIDQVVQTALPETKNPEEVSSTVKAFMAGELTSELIELLERIVLQGSDFSENKNLQNLLILTAIKADQPRVMEYINRLDNYDGPEIAKVAINSEYELFEEGLVIYTKFSKREKVPEERTKLHVAAMGVLVDNLRALDRAKELAERVNEAEVWSCLAVAQLRELLVNDAISSFIKAKDPSYYTEVIAKAEEANSYDQLTPYLTMARLKIKEPFLDTMLIYAFAKASKLGELEEFVSAPNVANIQSIGERCFDEELYVAAKILFQSINNNAKLALCYVKLKMFREAVDAASKANALLTWKEVSRACVDAEEFRLASICGMHIIVHPDHLEELIGLYVRAGHYKELIAMLEQGCGLEGAHAGVFTELAVLYSKYMPEKLMEHIKIFWSRMNIPKVLRACEKARLWKESVFLYKEDGQCDAAVKLMVTHPYAYTHELFLDCCQKVRNTEVLYQAVGFYLEMNPKELNKLLNVLASHLDHSRVVHLLRKSESLALAKPYLKQVQKDNLTAVNEALNELYIEEEDYESLRGSIDDFHNFEQLVLAQKVEKHELLEFRRIAAYLFKKNKRYAESIALSKGDKMYKDAIDTAAESANPELVEALMRFFVEEQKDQECFCACLYTCYSLVQPDVAIELAWRYQMADFAMPYVIQFVRHLSSKVKLFEERTAPKVEASESQAAESMIGIMQPESGMLMLGNGGGYGVPSIGYGGQGYGVPMPVQGYGMPPQGYGVPMTQQGYGMGGY
jgi:clathrin heavy chain